MLNTRMQDPNEFSCCRYVKRCCISCRTFSTGLFDPQAGVLSNAALICLAPILFMGLWGAGAFGGGSGLVVEGRAVCLAGVAVLAYVLLLEYDNGAPWHEMQGGVAVGKVLLGITARLVVYCAVKGLPSWKRLPAVVLLLAPLFYPPVVESLHRFKVCRPFTCPLSRA